jgi:hypothetical protein
MQTTPHRDDGCSAWNPGVAPGIPSEFRSLETIVQPELVFSSLEQVDELARLSGLPHEELTVFRPQRLALHELIIRVTTEIAVAEGEEEETFGRNFRLIAGTILDTYIAPRMTAIEAVYSELRQRAEALVRERLDALFKPPALPLAPRFPLNLFRAAPQAAPESVAQREERILTEYRQGALAAGDALQRAIFRSLHRVLGAISLKRGSFGSDQNLLVELVSRHVCNTYGSQLIGQAIAPLVNTAIEQEGYGRVCNRAAPVLISLKGASAAGKSSLRPMLKQVMREQGIEPDGYATISPDIWRRLLLDYESLGAAYKYAGHLTSRELIVIDGKLDRYIRFKARRDKAIPHLLVDRFRFDSFSSEQVTRVLHNTYAKYVDSLYMYFVVTPPEETVERGWQRALERGRYKAVEDFLGHSVEAYSGMPKILFKWLAHQRPTYRYFFLDNRVPKGTFPTTIAFGNQREMTIYDPVALIDIERYQKIDVHAASRAAVYPPAEALAATANAGFLKECIRRIELVNFADRASDRIYLRAKNGHFETLDATTLARVLANPETAAVIGAVAPEITAAAAGPTAAAG